MDRIEWRKISGGTKVLARDPFGNVTRSITSPSVYEGIGPVTGCVYRITKTGMGWEQKRPSHLGRSYSSTLALAKNNADASEARAAKEVAA
jgi:hypothetical protein